MGSQSSSGRGLARLFISLALAFFLHPAELPAQSPAQSRPGDVAPVDTSSLGSSSYARMVTLLEKTIFKVDVLTLEVWLAEEDAGGRIARLVREHRSYSRELADSIAWIAIDSKDAWARIEFLRGVSLGQFVDGIDENLRKAAKQGIISQADYEMIVAGLPRWFAFLESRRIQEGDRVVYRIRGDTLRTQFVAVNGEILLDQSDIGPERRRAVLGSYFARGSDFREGLIKSLF